MPALDFSKWSPGGNTTLFFPAAGLDAARQAELARQAMRPDSLGAEQAGFVSVEERRLRMAGGEFCVNATRAFGALLAFRESASPEATLQGIARQKLANEHRYEVQVSGWQTPIRLQVRGTSPHWQVRAELQLPPCPITHPEQGIHLDIATKEVTLTGHLSYGPFTPPAYDIMGPFCAVPFMQCRHGVLSLSHRLSGQLVLNRKKLNFDGGLGYIEKDWGRSFPSRYVWTQCTWTDKKTKAPCCVMLSVADIPFAGTHFNGSVGSVLFRGKEYRLATYKGLKILEFTDRELLVSQGGLMLHVNLIKDQPLSLAAPSFGRMSRTIKESAACQVRYQFFYQEKKIFDILCHHAGFESQIM